MKNTSDTRSRILDVAQDMVQRQSISGVSFQELANQIGIKKGSMYYHFESKDELSIALLERNAADLKASFERGESKSATKRLKYFLAIYRDIIIPGKRMCPGGAFASEWEKVSEPVKKSVNKVLNTQFKGVEDILTAGIEAKEFNSHDRPAKELALWIMSCLQGSLVLCRVEENQAPFDAAVATIESYLGMT
ncbi:TetR/AcrR family transcriptional regulator [Pleionea sp. CnH1-48]|uniref:TetR/AcrR family transcriptional regulator n=1 Tax=Pleionea sp. CnH1-48 TaxID=2954494 RepID=UPI002097D5C8|nr:TetR/AcrR family transcriptional regulator [Pleionea sp. CnH1-48]MCO7226482.1 TetR/AcrR family transcriptional regulator [Pleionea sp. CnH1-48]